MAGMYPDNETISLFGEEVSWPGVDEEIGKFTNGDFSNPMRKPSFIPAETVNLILDNLAGLIASLGGEPNNSDAAQLENAIADALALKADVNNPAFTGTPDVPAASDAVAAAATPTAAQNTRIATVGQIAATRNAINGDRMPVGSYYTQYPVVSATTFAEMFPANRTPAQLFGGTWTERFQGEEVFCRTTGGNSDTSGSQLGERRGQRWDGSAWAAGGAAGIEPDMIRNIIGSLQVSRLGNAVASTSGAITSSSSSSSQASTGNTYAQRTNRFDFNASRVVPTGTLNTPRNRLIRVWERTA